MSIQSGCGRVFYENYIGSIVDWYAATLFRLEPSLQFEGGTQASQNFLSQFADDCDLRGTTLTNFFRRTLTDTLVAGKSHILIDFPRPEKAPKNRAEEEAAGLSRAYLVHYTEEGSSTGARTSAGSTSGSYCVNLLRINRAWILRMS